LLSSVLLSACSRTPVCLAAAMGKKAVKKEESEVVESTETNEPSEEPKKEKKEKKAALAVELTEKKTNLGDSANIKRLLDDAAIDVLLSDDTFGYVEDTSMSNLKLVVGFSAVAASLLSQVYPASFPRNWWVLFFCCAFYFIMSGVLQLLLTFVELESIMILKADPKAKVTRTVRGLNVSSNFPRFQETYTLGITPIPGSGRGVVALARSPPFRPDLPEGNDSPHCLQQSWSVENYFDEDGMFAEESFMEAVKEFMHCYTAALESPPADSKKTK